MQINKDSAMLIDVQYIKESKKDKHPDYLYLIWKDLDKNEDVSIYVKLPKGFYINTPVGHYNPDWAIAFNEGSVKHIYFVAETKGSMNSLQLKPIEQAKINCAREHFKTISSDTVQYDVIDSYQALLDKVMT